MNWKIAGAVYVVIFGVLYQYDLLFTVFTLTVHTFVSLLGIYLGASWTLVRGKQYTPPPIPKELQHKHASIVLQNMMVGYSHSIGRRHGCGRCGICHAFPEFFLPVLYKILSTSHWVLS